MFRRKTHDRTTKGKMELQTNHWISSGFAVDLRTILPVYLSPVLAKFSSHTKLTATSLSLTGKTLDRILSLKASPCQFSSIQETRPRHHQHQALIQTLYFRRLLANTMISNATGISADSLTAIVNQNQEGTFWVFGSPYVNALQLNLLIIKDYP